MIFRKGQPVATKHRKLKAHSTLDTPMIATGTRPVAGNNNRRMLAIGAALVIITLAAFWGVRSASFVRMDDDIYVTENARVQSGLSWDNAKWAFSTNYFGFYYPLTWLSHMLDCQLYGTAAKGHHTTSLILHVFNVLLLFMVLARMSGAVWRSCAAAALFALHPLHVESVAWVAERKDVLSTFFWFLCLLAYVSYVKKPSLAKYGLVFSSFLLGLLAKPMLLTLPFTLLLLDYWPLRRWQPSGLEIADQQEGKRAGETLSLKQLIWEKLPLFALVPVFSLITFSAQMHANAVAAVSPGQRAANALLSYVGYLRKMLFPFDLAAYYPLPLNGVSIGLAALCGALLVSVTAAVLYFGKRRGYLIVGWLWYLGTLVPVIGLVQVGSQAMADRYTYVSLVGVFMIIAWGAAEIAGRNQWGRKIMITAFVAVLLLLAGLTRIQVSYWADNVTLFQRALSVTTNNWFVQYNLGLVLYQQGKTDEASSHFVEALRIKPDYGNAHNNLGLALRQQGKTEEAAYHFREAVRIDPRRAEAYFNLGNLFAEKGQNAEAIENYETALRIKPDLVHIQSNMGQLFMTMNRLPEAIEHYKEAVKSEPDFFDARCNLGTAFMRTGQLEAAIEQYQQAVRIDPRSAQALNNLGLALDQMGRVSEAIDWFKEAVKVAPESADAYINLGIAMWKRNNFAEAVDYFRQAVKVAPDSKLARSDLENAEKEIRAQKK
jgi:protein O-mannosyl-transferase